MNIIIVGASSVGMDLAEYLVDSGHAITLVDTPSDALTQTAYRLDLRVVQGEATQPSVLRRAGAENTELLVAVTPSDEFNITVCAVAQALFNVPRKIARIRSSELLSEADSLFGPSAIPIDHIIAPEHIMASYILDLLELPGTRSLGSFAGGRIVVASALCERGGKLMGHPLTEIAGYDSKARILALYRHGEFIPKFMQETLAEGDEIFFCSERSRVMSLLTALLPVDAAAKTITIAGGTHTADELAKSLSTRYRVKLIEPDSQRAERMSLRFTRERNLEVFHADPADPEFMDEEHLSDCDRFVAATPRDETNVISSLMLKRRNHVPSYAIIRREGLFDPKIQQTGRSVDVMISRRETVVSALISDIRQESVVKMRLFRFGMSEALELLVQGGRLSSKVAGRKIADLNLPSGVALGMVLRGNVVLPCTDDLKLEDGDHVIAYLHDSKQRRKLTALFKPRAFWIMRPRRKGKE